MNPYNPYQAPQNNEAAFGGAGPNESAQQAIQEALKRTRPWVLFLSILGFLAAGVMFLLGVATIIAGLAAQSFAKGGPFGGLTPALGLVYIVLGAFYVVPSVLLWQYGSSIGDFTRSGGTIDTLAVAVKKQSSFWRFTGISTAVMIGLYVVIIIIAVIVGAATAMSR